MAALRKQKTKTNSGITAKEILTMENNYYRITAYHPEKDISIIMDSFGLFEKKWQFSADLIKKGFKILGNELDLTITSRDVGLKERIPMVGFPYHAAENYFAKIVKYHDLYIIENERETQFIPSLLHIDNRLIDEDTGEILSEEDLREFDGDIYEPQGIDEPETVTKQSIPNEIFALFGNKVEVR